MSLTGSLTRPLVSSVTSSLLGGDESGPSISLSASDFGGSTYYEGVDDDDITVSISNATDGASWDLTISSSGGGTPVTANGVVSGTTVNAGAQDLTGLSPGALTFSYEEESVEVASRTRTLGGNYFANSVSGSDANAGTSAAPFATLGAVETAMSGEGPTRINLVAGSNFNEKLDITEDNSTVLFSGSGAAPIIDGAREMTGTWTVDGTYSNVWSQSWTRATAGSEFSPMQVWVDGAVVRFANSLADLSANGGWWTADRWGLTEDIYIASASNPNSNGVLYEAGYEEHGMSWHSGWDNGSGAAGVRVEGPIEIARHLGHYGPLSGGNDAASFAGQLLLRGGGLHHAVFDGDAEDIVCLEMPLDFQGSVDGDETPFTFTFYRDVAGGQARTAKRIFVKNDQPDQSIRAFYAHGSTSQWDAITIEQCAAIDCFSSLETTATEQIVDGFYQRGVTQGIFIDRSVTRVRRCLFDRPVYLMSHYQLQGSGPVDTEAKDTIIEDCCIYIDTDFETHMIRWLRNGSLTIRNCVIVFASGASRAFVAQVRSATAGQCSFTFEKNIVFFPSASGPFSSGLWNIHPDDTGNWSIDKNLYIGNPSIVFCRNDSTTYTYANYRSALGLDANSVFLDRTTYATALAEIFQGNPADGDFRLNDLTGLGAFGDSSALNTAGPQSHWDWDARASASGPPSAWPSLPESTTEARLYIEDPESWAFYPVEIFDNPSFDTDTDWLKPTGVTITGGEAVFASVASGSVFRQLKNSTDDAWYKYVIDVSEYTGGDLRVRTANNGSIVVAGIDGPGQYEVLSQSGSDVSSGFQFVPLGSTTLKLASVSAKLLRA